ncbi:hypothetical protein D3C85_1203150 [compost metagenome]
MSLRGAGHAPPVIASDANWKWASCFSDVGSTSPGSALRANIRWPMAMCCTRSQYFALVGHTPSVRVGVSVTQCGVATLVGLWV